MAYLGQSGPGVAVDMANRQFPLPPPVIRAPTNQYIQAPPPLSLGRATPALPMRRPNAAPLVSGQQVQPVAAPVNSQNTEYQGLLDKYNTQIAKVGGQPAAQVPLPVQPAPMIPAMQQYQEDSRHTAGLENLAEMSRTGGYSEQDKSDLRARGLSPIRAAYANMRRNMDANRSASGGYSPNFNAAGSRMAREQGALLGDQISNVNAGIAQNVASNRVGLAPQLASATGQVTGAKNAIEGSNVGALNRAGEFNTGMDLNYDQLAAQIGQNNIGNQVTQNNEIAQLLSGQGNLYGTTPARAALFGSQALQQSGQQAQQGQALMDAWLRANSGRA